MKKNITTNKMVDEVSYKIENDLCDALSIYSETPEVLTNVHEYKIMDMYWAEIYIYNPNTGILTFPEVETVQEVAKKYMRKYDDSCVYYSLQTFPVWKGTEFIDYPAIRVSVGKIH